MVLKIQIRKIIAVTGTNGKTTTCLMLKHIFNQTALNVLLAGNVGNSSVVSFH